MQTTPATAGDSIWLVEDDERQAAALEQYLLRHHPTLSASKVVKIATESEFLAQMHAAFDSKVQKPRLVIADVMLPWAFLGAEPEGVERPPEVNDSNGFRFAGARCLQALRKCEKHANAARTPFVFHSALPKEAFEFDKYRDAKTAYIPKDEPFDRLEQTIQEVTNLDAEWIDTPEEVEAELTRNPEMKRILYEGLRIRLSDCVPYRA